jgi:hypothetical protein
MQHLTQVQLMDLVVKGYTAIAGQRLYFKAKKDTKTLATAHLADDDELLNGGAFYFVLSPHYQKMILNTKPTEIFYYE